MEQSIEGFPWPLIVQCETKRQQEEQHVQTQEMRQALETNTRRYEWIQHREFEREMITRISINEQDQQVHETHTREQWRAKDNYDERQEEIEREQRRGLLDWPQ